MNSNYFLKIIKKMRFILPCHSKRNTIRNMMRGYHILRKENKLSLILQVKEDIANQKINIISKQTSTFFFGASQKHAELSLRQYLVVNLANNHFNTELLASIGRGDRKVYYPVPPVWVPILEKYNFKVSFLSSSILFYVFSLKMVFKGYAYSIIFIFKSILKKNPINNIQKTTSVYFDSLSKSNLPRKENSFSIINWYLNFTSEKLKITNVFHNLNNESNIKLENAIISGVDFPSFYINQNKNLLIFLFWLIASFVRLPYELAKRRWWHLLFFYESVKAATFRYQNPGLILKHYLFHNSNWIYRPIWTYEAEKMGGEILFYFYSTNCESFKQPTGYPVQSNTWQLMNWPNFLVWDEYQADFVRRAIGTRIQSRIQVVGNIVFNTISPSDFDISDGGICVFDVQPFRDSIYQTFGIDYEYYTPENACGFLTDILEVVRETNNKMIFKQKRNIGKMAHPVYRKLLQDMSTSESYIGVPPEISAEQIISKCQAVISMPFTSTAIIGKIEGKPSVYYDPYGKVLKSDRASHGVEIIIGKDELRTWLLKVINKNHE